MPQQRRPKGRGGWHQLTWLQHCGGRQPISIPLSIPLSRGVLPTSYFLLPTQYPYLSPEAYARARFALTHDPHSLRGELHRLRSWTLAVSESLGGVGGGGGGGGGVGGESIATPAAASFSSYSAAHAAAAVGPHRLHRMASAYDFGFVNSSWNCCQASAARPPHTAGPSTLALDPGPRPWPSTLALDPSLDSTPLDSTRLHSTALDSGLSTCPIRMGPPYAKLDPGPGPWPSVCQATAGLGKG